MMGDLLSLAADLVDIPSVSHDESALADHVESLLRRNASLRVERRGDSVLARTDGGRGKRLVMAGHLDTVPPLSPQPARVVDEVLWGTGAVDMKGGLAVLIDLAGDTDDAWVDLSFVFYACEEVERCHNALSKLAAEDPGWLAADAAVLCEPTAGFVEAGCQGTMRVAVTRGGKRAHSARPFMGVNAVHRLAPVLEALGSYESRREVIDGCEYVEQLQAVSISGGVAGNVVPDTATVVVNHRFAPGRDVAQAEAALRRIFDAGADGQAGDDFVVLDAAPGAPPSLECPLLAELVRISGAAPRAKVGWTDVATFWGIGVPAANFGPGDPLLAHGAEEHVARAELEAVSRALRNLVSSKR